MKIKYLIFFLMLIAGNVPLKAYIIGSQNQSNSLLMDSNKILSAGFTVINNKQFLLSSYDSTGELDINFGNNGCVTTSIGDYSEAFGIALDQSNKIVVAGGAITSGVSNIALARYTNSGVLDATFGSSGLVLTPLEAGCSGYALVIQSDGKIVVTGSLVSENGQVFIPLVRYEADGGLDTSFGTNGVVIFDELNDGVGYALKQQIDGKIIVAGFAEGQGFVARFLDDGTLDANFGENGITKLALDPSSNLQSISFKSDQSLIVAGFSAGQFLLSQLDVNGNIDTSFGSNGIVLSKFGSYNAALDMIIDSADRILVAGVCDDWAVLARYLSDGTLDTSFGNQGFVNVSCGSNSNTNAIIIQPDESIVMSGFADNSVLVARFTGDGVVDTSFGARGIVLDPSDYFSTCTKNTAFSPATLILDIKSSGVNGGTFTAGSWIARTLNNLVTTSSKITLDGNQFTLQPGAYSTTIVCPAYMVGNHKIRLQNITDNVSIISGTPAYSPASENSAVSNSIIDTSFAITKATTFEVQHRCNITRADDGFGLASDFGDEEVYTSIKIVEL